MQECKSLEDTVRERRTRIGNEACQGVQWKKILEQCTSVLPFTGDPQEEEENLVFVVEQKEQEDDKSLAGAGGGRDNQQQEG